MSLPGLSIDKVHSCYIDEGIISKEGYKSLDVKALKFTTRRLMYIYESRCLMV